MASLYTQYLKLFKIHVKDSVHIYQYMMGTVLKSFYAKPCRSIVEVGGNAFLTRKSVSVFLL